jgi:hypothetical protein
MYAADPPSKHGYMVMKSPTAKSLIAVVALLAAMTFAKARSTEHGRERALDPIIVDRKILITCGLCEVSLILRSHGRRAAA